MAGRSSFESAVTHRCDRAVRVMSGCFPRHPHAHTLSKVGHCRVPLSPNAGTVAVPHLAWIRGLLRTSDGAGSAASAASSR